MDHADAAMKLARAHECAAAYMVAEGNVHEVILEQAEALNCDLIIAGAHGHARIRELILGSTATYLMNHTERPLLLAR
ncbi:MAG: universal stress protein [Verrucomicrobia bacterium]|nr:universal stress protein [Verrucomicrobiota bacterium]